MALILVLTCLSESYSKAHALKVMKKNHYTPFDSKFKGTDKSDMVRNSNHEDNEEPLSLTLSQSPESYSRLPDRNISKTVVKNSPYEDTLVLKLNKPKRISQGSIGSVQNNRYNQPFEGERSGMSCSFGERLLDTSRLVSEDFASPSQSKTFKSFSKYLNKSDNKTQNESQNLMEENRNLIRNIKKSQDKLMKSPTCDELQPPINLGRYNRGRAQPQENATKNNQTFSTFGPNDELPFESNKVEEDRFRPARTSNSQNPKAVFDRLYVPNRKDKVSI